MIICTNSLGGYLRRAELDDAAWLAECLQDWAVKTFTTSDITQLLSNAAQLTTSVFTSPRPQFSEAIFIFCLSNGTRVGAISLSFQAEISSTLVKFDFGVIHPTVRAQGHFASMIILLGWFLNRHLKLDDAYAEILEGASQVFTYADHFQGRQDYTIKARNNVVNKVGVALENSRVAEYLQGLPMQGFSAHADIPVVTDLQRFEVQDRVNKNSLMVSWSTHAPTALVEIE